MKAKLTSPNANAHTTAPDAKVFTSSDCFIVPWMKLCKSYFDGGVLDFSNHNKEPAE